ncbi:transporter [Leptospira interrogans serovar Ricardi]|uniref:OmpP1/FadL family transporter n=1 Tax=Leptospira interrogans TaxID=173 RepID=UPI0021590C23|nr:transporter [Leptospira interrogans]MCR8638602.1 transporter [Leptospira interrogans serovar Ricardi]
MRILFNRIQKSTLPIFIGLGVFISFPSLWAVASNSRNAINARYEGMAGVNFAVGGSPMDVALNPANLYLMKGKKIEFGLGMSHAQIRLKDQFLDSDPSLNYTNSKSRTGAGAAPYMAVKLPVTDTIDYGFAAYVFGVVNGAAEKINRNTPTGETVNQWAGLPGIFGDGKRIQETTENQGIFIKAVNGLSIKFGNLSLGASLELNYGAQNRNIRYYDAFGIREIPGQGFHYESRKNALALSGIIGSNYTVTDWFRIAYVYQSSANFPFDGSYTIGVNDPTYYRSTGVSYNFRSPEKHGLGFAVGPENLKVAIDFLYINYGSYLKNARQNLEDPWYPNPQGRSSETIAHLNYRNQWAVLIGLEHKITKEWTYRFGYSYNSPIVSSNALNGAQGILLTLNHVIAGGFSYSSGPWSFDFGASCFIPGRQIEGGKDTDWAISHGIFGPNNQNNIVGYSYSAQALHSIGINFGVTRSFD